MSGFTFCLSWVSHQPTFLFANQKTEEYLDKNVFVVMDRPLGSAHPKHGFIYEVNYGYIPGTVSGDGEELDAYVLGENVPLESFNGKVVAIVRRTNDDDDKLIVTDGRNFTDEEILKQINFQEKYFDSKIIR